MTGKNPRGPVTQKFYGKTVELLTDIHAVLEDSRRAGTLPLTQRQVLYRLMGTGKYGKEAEGRVQYAIDRARRAVSHPLHIQWDDIYDGKGQWRDPDAVATADDFIDWARDEGRRQRTYRQWGQPRFLVGWCEAQGLLPLLTPIAHERGLPMISSGGYDSTTVRHKSARLHSEWDQPWTVLHVGDLDEHGEDIFTALKEDLEAWAVHYGRPDIEVVRVAVTPAQVKKYSLPGNPDPRKAHEVQAEAMPPTVMRDVWREAIESRQDAVAFTARLDHERDMQAEIVRRLST